MIPSQPVFKMNIKKKNHQNWLKNKWSIYKKTEKHPLSGTLGILLFL
jgi:DNA polymerase/3'-5' exonuclease PolX